MEFKTKDIVEAAAKIIHESGIKILSIEELAGKMKIERSLLYPYLKTDDDILIMMLLNLENEIQQMIKDAGSKNVSPEEELQMLFEKIYKLLEYKPYFLSIIFITETMEKNTRLQNTLARIKISVRTYLLEVINHGKKETVFKNNRNSKSLVNNILRSFRSFMNEQRLIAKMAKELEIIRGLKDSDIQGNNNLKQSDI